MPPGSRRKDKVSLAAVDMIQKARVDQNQLDNLHRKLLRDRYETLQRHEAEILKIQHELEREIPRASLSLNFIQIPAKRPEKRAEYDGRVARRKVQKASHEEQKPKEESKPRKTFSVNEV